MNPAIARLLGRTLLWLPVSYATWYFTAMVHASLAGFILQYLINASSDFLISKETTLAHQTRPNTIFAPVSG